MDNQSDKYETDGGHPRSFFVGLLLGGLAGAGAMLLLAPQSGKRTRAKIRLEGIELRDQTADAIEDAVAQVRVKARQITADVRGKAKEIQQGGQDLLAEQGARLSAAVAAGKTVIQGT